MFVAAWYRPPQDQQVSAIAPEIDAVPGPEVNLVFGDSATNAFYLALIAPFESAQRKNNLSRSNVVQPLEPPAEWATALIVEVLDKSRHHRC